MSRPTIILAILLGVVVAYFGHAHQRAELQRAGKLPARASVMKAPARAGVVRIKAVNNMFVTTVTFNGAHGIEGLIDTGASTVSIMCDDLVRDLALPPGPTVTVQTANGSKTAYRVTLPSVRVGSIELTDVAGLVSRQNGPCQVLVGMTFLHRLRSASLSRNQLVLIPYPTRAR